MKKPDDKDTQHLETVLKKAYHEKEPVEPHGQWSARVMRAIHRRGPLKPPVDTESLGRFVWRIAPVAVVLIIALAACMVYFGVSPEYEMARYFVSNPIEFTVIESLGI